MSPPPVLITWVAVNNDPFERERETGKPRLVDGEPVAGPTLTLLCDEESSYAGQVTDVVLLHRSPEGGGTTREWRAVDELSAELKQRRFRVHLEAWSGDDPTDHRRCSLRGHP